MEEPTMPCMWCGIPTRMLATKKCDGCWELFTRIRGDLPLAERMIVAIKRERKKETA